MKRRFILSVSGLSDREVNELREYLKTVGWWNWIPNFWLLITSSDVMSCEKLRNKVVEINSDAKCLAMEIPADLDWAYHGAANDKGKTMGEWLKTTWAEE